MCFRIIIENYLLVPELSLLFLNFLKKFSVEKLNESRVKKKAVSSVIFI